MLELRRLRLLRELRDRGTIAAVADALQFTPSAVSQQLAVLERETGVALIERAGRGVRLTDAALVLAAHSEALLERVALAEAELAEATGALAGRARVAAFQSVSLHLAIPAMRELARPRAGSATGARRVGARAGPSGARARRRRSRPGRRVAAPAARASARRRPARPVERSGADRAAGGSCRAAPAAPRGPAGRARRRGVGDGPRGARLGRDDDVHLPDARRVRSRRPSPHERRGDHASRSSPAASPSRCCPSCR